MGCGTGRALAPGVPTHGASQIRRESTGSRSPDAALTTPVAFRIPNLFGQPGPIARPFNVIARSNAPTLGATAVTGLGSKATEPPKKCATVQASTRDGRASRATPSNPRKPKRPDRELLHCDRPRIIGSSTERRRTLVDERSPSKCCRRRSPADRGAARAVPARSRSPRRAQSSEHRARSTAWKRSAARPPS